MSDTTVSQAYEQLKATPFPQFPEDDEFADVVAELAELDGHVAGVAASLIGGTVPAGVVGLREAVTQLHCRLNRLFPGLREPEDHIKYQACQHYIGCLHELVLAISRS